MMRKFLIPVIMLLMLSNFATVQGNLDLSRANFSGDVEIDNEYRWNIENYQVGDRRIESKSSPTSFEFIHGSDISLTVLKNPSDVNLADHSDISSIPILSEYFLLSYDDVQYSFVQADQLYIWIFPTTGIQSGDTVDLLEEFWIYNLYNILTNGETLNFDSSFPGNGTVSKDTDGNEITLSLDYGGVTLQARVDEPTGIMNSVNYVSAEPDFRIEIDRRGGGSGALPLPTIWIIIPLITIPLIIRYLKRR